MTDLSGQWSVIVGRIVSDRLSASVREGTLHSTSTKDTLTKEFETQTACSDLPDCDQTDRQSSDHLSVEQ